MKIWIDKHDMLVDDSIFVIIRSDEHGWRKHY